MNGISLHPDVDPGTLVPDDPNKVEPLVSASASASAFASAFASKPCRDSSGGAVCDHDDGGLKSGGKSLLAVAIGSRQFPSESDWENDDPLGSLTNRTNNFIGSTHVYTLSVP